MVWTPKSTAPATFNLADAFLALITGDAVWGWLVDWLPYVTNDHFDTAAFCAFGPTPAPDLSVLLSASPPDRSPLAVVAKIAALGGALGLAARDRVFGAYCEEVGPLTGGWGAWEEVTNSGTANFHVEVDVHKPAGATSAQVEIIDAHWGALANGGINLTQIHNPADASQNVWYGPTAFNAIGQGPLTNTTLSLSNWPDVRIQTISDAFVHARVRWNVADVTDYVPEDQPLPAGLLSPLRPVDPTLDGIDYETQLLEFKLDTMLSIIQSIAGATIDLGGPAGDPADLPPDTPIEIADAVGCVLTASGIPASRTLDFGTPQNIVKLGHVNFGTADAWYPSIWMTHSPMVVRPFPPGTTRVTVTDLPPGVTVQIALLSRTK
jgi:hypothetical protein